MCPLPAFGSCPRGLAAQRGPCPLQGGRQLSLRAGELLPGQADRTDQLSQGSVTLKHCPVQVCAWLPLQVAGVGRRGGTLGRLVAAESTRAEP